MTWADEVIGQLNEDQIKCRGWHAHLWKDYTVDVENKQYVVTQVCGRCDLFRSCRINSKGQVVKRWKIEYGDSGYLIKGAGKPTQKDRDRVRLAAVKSIDSNVRSIRRKRAG